MAMATPETSGLYRADAQTNAYRDRPMPQAVQAKDPRLHAINNAVCSAIERVRELSQALSLKADAIVGSRPEDANKGEGSPPSNGALDQIEMSCRTLHSALDALVDAERRFAGLA